MAGHGGSVRLRSVFHRALLVVLGPPTAIYACGNVAQQDADAGAGSVDEDAGAAATLGPDAVVPLDTRAPPSDTGVCRLPDAAAFPPLPADYKVCRPLDAGFGFPFNMWPVSVPCGSFQEDGGLSLATCGAICPDHGYPEVDCNARIFRDKTDAIVVGCWNTCDAGGGGAGRRPGGCTVSPTRATSRLGGFFANMAQLEAMSIAAFAFLRDELRAHGAPSSLVDRAEDAVDDERRHTRVTSALARRFGGVPTAPVIPPLSVRPLRDVALENAAEGCVRETFGALVAIYQAERAEDQAVRCAMKRIAEDESRHAELAWDIAVFCEDRLDDAERSAVRAAMREALEALRAEVARPVHEDVRRVAGMPSRADARRLLACLEDAVAERSAA